MVKYHAQTFLSLLRRINIHGLKIQNSVALLKTSARFFLRSYTFLPRTHITSHVARVSLCPLVYWHFLSAAFVAKVEITISVSPEHFSVSSALVSCYRCLLFLCDVFGGWFVHQEVYCSPPRVLPSHHPLAFTRLSFSFILCWWMKILTWLASPILPFSIMHHLNPRFRKGVMDVRIMWVRELISGRSRQKIVDGKMSEQ